MEEKPKPRSVILLEVALVFGALSGLIGGIYGIAVTAGKGGPSERVVIPTLIAAPIVGAVFVVAVWLLMPRPKARSCWPTSWAPRCSVEWPSTCSPG